VAVFIIVTFVMQYDIEDIRLRPGKHQATTCADGVQAAGRITARPRDLHVFRGEREVTLHRKRVYTVRPSR
jgi:hypothetical protein